ncbi:UNVERIFIED_CONTAM: hypothetical protein GTU68_001593 [Idotea baltica]|nr:hypothetical protein [Idotea baltica]
MVLSAIL